MRCLGVFALATALVAGPSASAQPAPGGATVTLPSISMDVAPAAGSMDDRFVATVRVAVADIATLEHYEPPGLDAFEIVDHRSDRTATQQYQSGQGRVAAVFLTYRYTLAPKRTGILRIGPARARIGGADFRTRARGVEVKDVLDRLDSKAPKPTPHGPKARPSTLDPSAHVAPDPATGAPPDIFVRTEAEPTIAYVGQQITVTWSLYTRHEIIEIEPDVPRMDDFWSEILFEPSTFSSDREEIVSGIRYRVFTVSRRALFPLRAGKLQLAPYRAKVATLYTPLGQRTDAVGSPLTIEAKALPEGAPVGFDPTFVGRFRLQASIDRPRVEVGQPFTLTLVVKGHGAIRRTRAPMLSFPGFTIEAPRDFDESLKTTDKSVLGQRVYRYFSTATTLGAQTIPAIEVPYFDPHLGRYSTARTQPIDIEVIEVGAGAAGDRTLATGAGRASTGDAGGRSHWWLVGGAVLGAVLFVGLLLGRRSSRDDGRASDELDEELVARLQRADEHLQSERSTELFAELNRILEHCLERLSKTITTIPTRDQRIAQLRTEGADAQLISDLERELNRCDMARFAASKVTLDDMRESFGRVRKLTRECTRVSAE